MKLINTPKKEEELKLGKQEQFMFLYSPVHARLARFVHSMVWNHEDARDIIAETVLKAYENFEKLEHHEAFLYFLFGIASRLSKRRGRRVKIWAPYNSEYAENIADNNADAHRRMETELLYAAMKRLPEKQREAISLFEISGFSLAEIQKIQGGSLSGVKSRITRGREALARILSSEFGFKGSHSPSTSADTQPLIQSPVQVTTDFSEGVRSPSEKPLRRSSESFGQTVIAIS